MSRLLLALILAGAARAETATFRLTPEKTDTPFHAFTIQAERREEAGAGKVLHVRVAAKRKAGGPGPAWREGRLDVFDGKEFVASCAVEPAAIDGGVAYTFRVAERFAGRSKFTVGELLGDLDSVYSWFYVGDFLAAEGPPKGEPAPPPATDLSQFPTLRGKVTAVVGSLNSFVPPEVGQPFELPLKGLPKLTHLPFDPETKSYIPLEGPVVVESVRYYSNGGFRSMRLVSPRDPKLGPGSVTIDVVPVPGAGRGPKGVRVWVVVQQDVVTGVAVLDGVYEGAFPDRAE